MGKKYIIELEEAPFIQHFDNGIGETIYRVKGFNSLVFDWNGLQMLTPYTEPDMEQVRKEAYEKGLSDAWEAARKIVLDEWDNGIKYDDFYELFNGKSCKEVLETYTASECIEKIRQYEQEKEEQKEEKPIPVEDVMRQYLATFCNKKRCKECPLDTPDFTCGRGYHFLTKSPESRVSDEEVRRAYVTVLQKMRENNDNK